MSDASTSSAAAEERYGFPKALAAWLARNGDVLDSLLALRRLGAEGAEAVSAVLYVRRVVEVRASWQLWEALTEGEGDDPDTLVLRVLPVVVVDRARRALWGPSWRGGESPEPAQPLAPT